MQHTFQATYWVVFLLLKKNIKIFLYDEFCRFPDGYLLQEKTQKMKLDFKISGGHLLPETT